MSTTTSRIPDPSAGRAARRSPACGQGRLADHIDHLLLSCRRRLTIMSSWSSASSVQSPTARSAWWFFECQLLGPGSKSCSRWHRALTTATGAGTRCRSSSSRRSARARADPGLACGRRAAALAGLRVVAHAAVGDRKLALLVYAADVLTRQHQLVGTGARRCARSCWSSSFAGLIMKEPTSPRRWSSPSSSAPCSSGGVRPPPRGHRWCCASWSRCSLVPWRRAMLSFPTRGTTSPTPGTR